MTNREFVKDLTPNGLPIATPARLWGPWRCQNKLDWVIKMILEVIWLNTAKTLNKCSIDILGTELVRSRSYPFYTRELAVDWETITSTTHTELFSRGCLLENPKLSDWNWLPAAAFHFCHASPDSDNLQSIAETKTSKAASGNATQSGVPNAKTKQGAFAHWWLKVVLSRRNNRLR